MEDKNESTTEENQEGVEAETTEDESLASGEQIDLIPEKAQSEKEFDEIEVKMLEEEQINKFFGVATIKIRFEALNYRMSNREILDEIRKRVSGRFIFGVDPDTLDDEGEPVKRDASARITEQAFKFDKY